MNTTVRNGVGEGGAKYKVTEMRVDYERVRWNARGVATHPEVPHDFEFHSAGMIDGEHVAAVFSKMERA